LVTERPSWFRLLAIAVLLLAFGVSARGGFRPSRNSDSFATSCELNPPRDVDALERCLALQPRDIEIMLDLGSIYEGQAKSDRAEAVYRQALAVDPKDGDVHVRLGQLLLQRGNRAAAADEAKTALGYQPRSPRALELLAAIKHGVEQ